MALMAGKVMLDMAATAPAAHIILGEKEAAVMRQAAEGQPRLAVWQGSISPRHRATVEGKQTGTNSYQGCDPKPYQASCRIWKPSPNRMVFLFPIERMRIPNTTVWKEKHVLSKLSAKKDDSTGNKRMGIRGNSCCCETSYHAHAVLHSHNIVL